MTAHVVHRQFFVGAGAADSQTQLNAFDHALLAARVGDVNLVRLSSILPPGCEQIEPHQLPYGALVPVAYASMTSSESGAWIAAAIAIAIPLDDTLPGLIMEHHGFGRLDKTEAQVREMAIRGMNHRNREIKDVIVLGIEHQVEEHGAVFSGVALCG